MKHVLIITFVIGGLSNSFGQVFERTYGQPMGGFHWLGPVCYSQDRIYMIDREEPSPNSPNTQYYSAIRVLNPEGKFLFDFGSYGTGDGQFKTPQGIAADKDGNIYATDPQNHRIQKFDKNGRFISTLGLEANGTRLVNPVAIAVNKDNVIFVGDNNRIVKYGTDGTLKGFWGESFNGEPGSGPNNGNTGQFSLATHPITGNLLMGEWKWTDFNSPISSNSAVREFDLNGNSKGGWLTQLPDWLGITADASGNVIAINDNKRLTVKAKLIAYRPNHNEKWNIDAGLFDPIGICTDGKGKIYIVENGRIHIFQDQETSVSGPTTVGESFSNSASSTSGRLDSPYSTVVDKNGNVYVMEHSSVFNPRVSKFPAGSDPIDLIKFGMASNLVSMTIGTDNSIYVLNGTANVVSTIQGSTITAQVFKPFLKTPYSITINPDGDLLISDEGKIFKQPKTGALVTMLSPQGDNAYTRLQGITTDATGNIYGSDINKNMIFKLDKNGGFLLKWGGPGSLAKQFNGAMGIAIGPDNHVYVADTGNNRIQEFTDQGDFLQSFGKFGSAEHFFNAPYGITFSGDNFYVTELNNNRVQKFNRLLLNSVSVPIATRASNVTVTGLGFGSNLDFTSFRINNVLIPVATQANTNEVTLTLPPNATTGYVSVTRDGYSSFSKKELVIGPLAINGFTPLISGVGRTIKVSGSGFSINNATNVVTIGGVPANVTRSSFTQLEVTVPPGVVKGKIKVVVEGQPVESSDEFTPTAIVVTEVKYPESYLFGSETLDVSITVSDPSQVKEARFHYRGISSGETNYKSLPIPLPILVSNTLKYSVSKLIFNDPIGLKGYVVLIDAKSVELALDEAYIYNSFPAASTGNAIPGLSFGESNADYQLVSFPFDFNNKSSTNVFRDLGEPDTKKWRLFGLKNEEPYEITTTAATIALGHSFWLIARNPTVIRGGEGHTFFATDTSAFELELTSGWNMIGNPYNFAISWNDVLEANNNPQVGGLRLFNAGNYDKGDVLKAYGGAFVNNFGLVDIKLKVPAINKKLTGGRVNATPDEQSFDKDHWSINLTASDGTIRNELAGIGMKKEAIEGLDRFDEQELPAPEGLNTFNLSMRKIGTKNIINDVVSTSDAYTWTGTLSASNGVTLEWRNDVSGGANKQLVMEIEGVAALVDMRSASTIDFAEGNHSFKIHYGDAKYIKEKTTGKEILVGNIAPNPLRKSNSMISVPVSVPQGGAAVSIRLLDMNGKSHFVAGERQLSEGRHVVEFQSDVNLPGRGMFIAEVTVAQSGRVQSFFSKVIID